jgi:hypothetical protein
MQNRDDGPLRIPEQLPIAPSPLVCFLYNAENPGRLSNQAAMPGSTKRPHPAWAFLS